MTISEIRPAPPRRLGRKRTASIEDGLMGVALLAGPANVIMQLGLPPVGYGVLESRVEGGRVDKHPIKRARTTFTYLAVAGRGSDVQKAAFRKAVNGAHAQVRSTAESPVQYNAFDPKLQLWVAACLYKGAVDVYRLFVGEMDEETADQHYAESIHLGTTLQVPAAMWPADRAAFESYWNESLNEIHIDDTVRRYLQPIAAGRAGLWLPGPVARLVQSISLLITTGFLPPRFRAEMRLAWDDRRQRRFDRLMAVVRVGNNLAPSVLRQFPFNVLLWDVDRRIRRGLPLV